MFHLVTDVADDLRLFVVSVGSADSTHSRVAAAPRNVVVLVTAKK